MRSSEHCPWDGIRYLSRLDNCRSYLLVHQETLLCIQDKATAITRRSAGIPSLMVGIIGAESTPNGPLFHQAMHDLANIAKLSAESSNIQDSRLPQVHALNCVKDIFTTSRLSASSEMYISESLDLAAQTLNSKV